MHSTFYESLGWDDKTYCKQLQISELHLLKSISIIMFISDQVNRYKQKYKRGDNSILNWEW